MHIFRRAYVQRSIAQCNASLRHNALWPTASFRHGAQGLRLRGGHEVLTPRRFVHSWRTIIQVYVALAASDATPHVRSAIGPGEAYLSAELGPAAPLRYDLSVRLS